jgi:hypothetical protein
MNTPRKMSEATRAILEPAAASLFNEHDIREGGLWRIFQASHIPHDATVTGIEQTGKNGSLYEFYRIAFTQPAATKEAPNFEKVEIPAGQVQIIDYSEKAIAVVGDTRPIKGTLKNLGGKFNPRLTCGPGWIFSKKTLDAVTKALQGPRVQSTEKPKHPGLAEEVQKTLQWFVDTDLKNNGQISDSTREAVAMQAMVIEEPATFNYVG